MSVDIERTVCESIKRYNMYILHSDEISIASFHSYLYGGNIVDHFLYCKELGGSITGQDKLQTLNHYLCSVGLA